jgi:hypothetical protein
VDCAFPSSKPVSASRFTGWILGFIICSFDWSCNFGLLIGSVFFSSPGTSSLLIMRNLGLIALGLHRDLRVLGFRCFLLCPEPPLKLLNTGSVVPVGLAGTGMDGLRLPEIDPLKLAEMDAFRLWEIAAFRLLDAEPCNPLEIDAFKPFEMEALRLLEFTLLEKSRCR